MVPIPFCHEIFKEGGGGGTNPFFRVYICLVLMPFSYVGLLASDHVPYIILHLPEMVS